MGGRDGLDVEVVHANVHPRRRDRDEAVVEEDVPIDSMANGMSSSSTATPRDQREERKGVE